MVIKSKKMKQLSFILFFMYMASNVLAQDAVYLYPEGVPGLLDTTNREVNDERPDGLLRLAKVTQPCIYPYIPAGANEKTPAVLICPGGGYHIVSMTAEGFNVAEWLQAHGVAAFVLKYRLPDAEVFEDKSIVPLQDVQSAFKFIRENAKVYNIDTKAIGVMGFSAGGHLAASASVLYKNPLVDAKAKELRPAFSILIYPVISFEDGLTHKGSRNSLIGPKWDKATQDYYSCEKQVDKDTPPAFLLHAKDDKGVPCRNSVVYKEALDAHGVVGKLVFFEKGGHGFGFRPGKETNRWLDEAFQWMSDMNIVNP